MAKVITFAMQKGGVAKTSTSIAVAEQLIKRGYDVLCVDMDPQCNFTKYMKTSTEADIKDVLQRKQSVVNALCKLDDHCYMLPCDSSLYNATNNEIPIESLQNILKEIDQYFDYVVIDTPPNLGPLTNTAVFASDYVVLPTLVGTFCLDGLESVCATITTIKELAKSKVEILGFLVTRLKPKMRLNESISAEFFELAGRYNTRVFNTKIREKDVLEEAQGLGESIFTYSPRSAPAKDYKEFVDEMLAVIGSPSGAPFIK